MVKPILEAGSPRLIKLIFAADPGRGFENPLLLKKCVNSKCFLYKLSSSNGE